MASSATWTFRKPSIIPGFGLALGFTLTWLGLIVLIPLAGLVLKTASLGWPEFLKLATDPRILAALKLSFGASLLAATINAVFGLIVAWVLVRYDFPGRRLLDAFVDLPFALPTAVAGIALTALYAPNGWIGSLLAPLGIKVAYTPLGIVIALIFIGLPFVVRTLQPVMEEIDREVEEAAATLGASRFADAPPRHPADAPAAAPHRLRAGARPRRRRVRLGDLHRRQHPLRLGDRAAAHRRQAAGVQLPGRHGGRHAHAPHLVRAPACDQPDPGLEPPEVRQCMTTPSRRPCR